MEYRSHEEIQRFQFDAQAPARLLNALRDDSTLLDEVAGLMRHYSINNRGDFYYTHVAKEIACYNSQIELAIRSRVLTYLAKFAQLGIIQWSRSDHNEESNYRCLTPLGVQVISDGSYRHLALGPAYTLKTLSSAVVLLTLPHRDDSGTALHLGNGVFLTCAHCAPEGEQINLIDVSNPDKGWQATLERVDRSLDVALLRSSLIPPASLRVSPIDPQVLDPVLVLHFPNVPAIMRSLIATTGEINGRAMAMFRSRQDDALISARTAPGSSGGAVISDRGYLSGLVVGSGASVQGTSSTPDSSTWHAEPFYHAIPADQLRSFLA